MFCTFGKRQIGTAEKKNKIKKIRKEKKPCIPLYWGTSAHLLEMLLLLLLNPSLVK